MNFKELVEEAAGILSADYVYDDVMNIYTIKLIFDENTEEKVYIYQDTFENENDGISKKIIVCESPVGKFEGEIDLLLLSTSNEDLYFSRSYVSEEEKKILVESCTFMENLNALNLSAIIDEIAQHSSFLKEELGL